MFALFTATLVTSLFLQAEGARYTKKLDLQARRVPVNTDCHCSAWEYVDQCGDDCRQFRWRDCEDSQGNTGCDTEDESVPCYSVEWGEWGSCDQVTCARTRTQSCMCLMRRVSPDICMIDLETQTEPCSTEIVPGNWGSCDDSCHRSRTSTCTCTDPGSSSQFTVPDSMCGLSPGERVERQACQSRVDHSAWSSCDERCNQERSASCWCEDQAGHFNTRVNPSACSLSSDESQNTESRRCNTEWGDWVLHGECPKELPKGDCDVFIKRYRHCNCIDIDTQGSYPVKDINCGMQPSTDTVHCPIEPQCMCMINPGDSAECKRTCDEQEAGRKEGSPPTCSCSPWWYRGSCDPGQMEPDWKMCRVEPSQWNEWSSWSPQQCDSNCRQERSRTCGCFDGIVRHISDLSKCAGQSQETRECDKGWSEWENQQCPLQREGDCEVKARRYRQCNCLSNGENMGASSCEGEATGFSTNCPLDPYGECKCNWVSIGDHNCDPDRLTCKKSHLTVGNVCRCTPSWYHPPNGCGEKPDLGAPTLCEPTIDFEWSEWSDWSECDLIGDCDKTRTRTCQCTDDSYESPYSGVDGTCEGLKSETVTCDVVWSRWEGGCAELNESCTPQTATQTRVCCCAANTLIKFGENNPEEAELYCRLLEPTNSKATREETCPVKEYELTGWGAWNDCDMTCKTRRERDCQCNDTVTYSEKGNCLGEAFEETEDCAREWSDWSDPNCGETTCVMKTRPKYRRCMCTEPSCEIERDECPGKLFEIAEKCPFIPPEDPSCQACECSDWQCSDQCDNTFKRTCSTAGCDIEVRYTKEDCCPQEPQCVCTEWGCKASCDHTMIRTCPNQCDIEEKDIAQACCDNGATPGTTEECTCTEWGCKESCDHSMIRNCENQCDIEEKEIGQACCDAGSLGPEEPECACTEWGCKASCDHTMIRTCPNQCDIEEKDIAQACCDSGADPQIGGLFPGEGDEECECEEWVPVECHSEGDTCVQEEWRVCAPASCAETARNVTDSECCEHDTIPDDCSSCGRWIDIGNCTGGEAGTHQWRSVRKCGEVSTCDEFRCVQDGQHCNESLCGEWYDIGDCEMDGHQGSHQWRTAEDCYCEPYRCHITDGSPADLRHGPDSLQLACQCSPWVDMSGCNARCVNTESRSCSPLGCAEEYRIRSGFCCK